MPNRLGRRLAVLAAVSLLALTGLVGCSRTPEVVAPPAPETSATPTPTSTPTAPDPIHLIAMGDMLPHASVLTLAQVPGGHDFGKFFAPIQKQLDDADVTFCNQEVPSAGVDFGLSGYPVFNAPIQLTKDLVDPVGCDLVNTATNHAADKGVAGIAATRNAWDPLAPTVVAGTNRSAEEQRTVPIFESDGVKIALVAFAEFSNIAIDSTSLNFIGDTALVNDLMAQAREKADIVVVSAHWGTEDSHAVNGQQRAFAQTLTDLGADVIIGTGPHVLQPVEWLTRADGGRTLVWYSIGNMMHTQLSLAQRTGVLAGFDLVRDAKGGYVRVENPMAIFTYTHYDWTAAEEAAGNIAARTNLSINLLADSDELLTRTRFGVTAAQQVAASTQILGPDVTILER